MITTPPTKLSNGGEYKWVVSPSQGVVAPPPKRLIQLIRQLNTKKSRKIKTSITSVDCNHIAGKSIKQLSQKQRSILNERLDKAMKAPTGSRSSRDFSLMDWIVRVGLKREVAWELVKNVGKFKEKGREYFDRTFNAAVSNVTKQLEIKEKS
jgi:hypothetical protein